MKKQKITFVELSDIAPGALQLRSEIDSVGIDELSNSIKQNGVMQPVTLRRREEVREVELNGVTLRSEKYEIVAGERRWRAAKKAGLTKIPCVIIGADDKNAAIASLIENLQREDLEFFDCAEAIKRIQEQFGISKGELTRRLCMSQEDIEKSLELLELSVEERTIIRCAKLSEAHARLFLRIEDDEMRFLLLKKAASARGAFLVFTVFK